MIIRVVSVSSKDNVTKIRGRKEKGVRMCLQGKKTDVTCRQERTTEEIGLRELYNYYHGNLKVKL